MKKTNVASLRHDLSKILSYVQRGNEIEIQKRNITIAKIVPITMDKVNKTKLGCGKRTGKIIGDITEPGIPLSSWEMFK